MSRTTTSSSVNSSSTTKRENSNCYFPSCRKDTKCHCEMCLASIHATRDLMPFSSLTKLSSSRPHRNNAQISPVAFNAASPSTIKPTKKRLRFDNQIFGFSWVLKRVLFGLCLLFMAEFGFCWFVNRVLRDGVVFNGDVVKGFGESGLSFRELERYIGKVGNCSLHGDSDSEWTVQQDGLLLVSKCTLYKSMIEEVSVWGWPLQTAGLLTTGWSSRLFTVMSGRVTEWADGGVGYVVRKENSSWVHKKWDVSAVKMDPNTWVLEYKQSSVLENPSLFRAALELLSYWMSRILKRLNQKFWFSAVCCQCGVNCISMIPT